MMEAKPPKAKDDALADIFRDMMLLESGATISSSPEFTTSDLLNDLGVTSGNDREALIRRYFDERKTELRKRILSADLSPFHIIEEIESGGMGIVFRARQESPMFTRDVALKFLITGDRRNKNECEQFVAEAKGLAALNHPFLVSIYDSGIKGDLYYFSMELVRGHSLANWPADQPMGLERKIEIVRDVARALDYLHQNSVIHRDIKPANIMIAEDGTPKLLDFGISQFSANPHERVIQAGTPHYMAPEVIQLEDFGSIGPASDIYALGVVLYRLLKGREPFDDSRSLSVIFDKTLHAPIEFDARSSKIPYELQRIILRCLRKQVTDRYEKAAHLAEDLDQFLRRRRQRWLRSIAMASVVTLGLVFFFLYQGDDLVAHRGVPEIDYIGAFSSRIDEVRETEFATIQPAAREIEAIVASFDTLLAAFRGDSGIAATELSAKLHGFWSDKLARAITIATLARGQAMEALKLALDDEDAAKFFDTSQELNLALTPEKESFDIVAGAIVSFRQLEDVARERHKKAEEEERLKIEKQTALEARERSREQKGVAERGDRISISRDVGDSFDKAGRLFIRAEGSFASRNYVSAKKDFEASETSWRMAIRRGRDRFVKDVDILHGTLISRTSRVAEGRKNFALSVVKKEIATADGHLNRAEEAWQDRNLDACRERLASVDAMITMAEGRSAGLRIRAESAKSAATVAQEELVPEPLGQTWQQILNLEALASEAFEARNYVGSLEKYRKVASEMESFRHKRSELLLGMIWIPEGHLQGRSIKAFWIDRCELSLDDFRQFLEMNPSATHFQPAGWRSQKSRDGRLPVIGVDLRTAEQYAASRGAVIPTRDMWELAARSGENRALYKYPYGNEFRAEFSNGEGGLDGFEGLAPVDSLHRGASGHGGLHFSGNAAEYARSNDSEDAGIAYIMGGSFDTGEPQVLLCDRGLEISVSGRAAERKHSLVGFRCALTVWMHGGSDP